MDLPPASYLARLVVHHAGHHTRRSRRQQLQPLPHRADEHEDWAICAALSTHSCVGFQPPSVDRRSERQLPQRAASRASNHAHRDTLTCLPTYTVAEPAKRQASNNHRHPLVCLVRCSEGELTCFARTMHSYPLDAYRWMDASSAMSTGARPRTNSVCNTAVRMQPR